MSPNATGKVCPKRSKRQFRNRKKKWNKKRNPIQAVGTAIPSGTPANSATSALVDQPVEWPIYLDAGTYGRMPAPLPLPKQKPERKSNPAVPPPIRLSTNSVCPLCKDLGQLSWHKVEDSPAIVIYCLCPIGTKLLAQDVNEIQRLGAPRLPAGRYYAEIQFEPVPDEAT